MPDRKPVEPEAGYSRQYRKLGGKSQKTKIYGQQLPVGLRVLSLKLIGDLMIVVLSHVPNPSIPGGYLIEPLDSSAQTWIEVGSYREASDVCRKFIEKNELNGGNWTGGQVFINGSEVANISYNGRAWDMQKREISLEPKGS